ncbi:4-hydroxybenzoate octaprenyltransferase [Polymorphobacter sp.]|uniref:4-hydroxybenzoate octaprenyltransferase n=1 Tax=Polymorphobacter sp. TaxID=1909290 RepID=UPI003F6F3B06
MASTAPLPPKRSIAAEATPDAEAVGWIDKLPPRARAYARLARLDRPIGAWLLYWPAPAGLALAGGLYMDWALVLWFALGAFAMRAAGCVWNDIVDRDLDARVARTRARPVASGAISVRAALIYAVALSAFGLIVLLQLRPFAQIVALASLALVAAYPFMKRITWWPQAWLGLTFNWGALVGYTAITDPAPPMLLLYAAGIAWTLGYDTIYALQDIEDDAMAGIRSSARRLGRHARIGIALFYALSAALLATALYLALPDPLSPLAALPFALHLAWQVMALRPSDSTNALRLFRANHQAGLLLFAATAVVGLA